MVPLAGDTGLPQSTTVGGRGVGGHVMVQCYTVSLVNVDCYVVDS